MHTRRRRLKGEQGVAMVEFALVLPLLMLVIVGMFEFGRAFNFWISTNHLANQGARFAVVDSNPGDPKKLQMYLKDSALTSDLQNGLSVCIDYFGKTEGGTLAVGDPVRVRVRKSFSFLPIVQQPTITFQGEATMRIERLEGNTTHTTPKSYTVLNNIPLPTESSCPA